MAMTRVITAQLAAEASEVALTALIEGSLDVLLVEGFTSAEVAAQASERGHRAFEEVHGNLPDTTVRQRLGTPLSEALKSEAGWRDYWAGVDSTERRVGRVVAGIGDPLHELWRRFESVWPDGVATPPGPTGEGLMLSRIMRRWPAGGEAHPHIDPSSNRMIEHLGLRRRLAVNVYLDNGRGGELQLWSFMDYGDYRRLHDPVIGGVPIHKIGAARLSLHPRPGDLIIFDSSILHAVAPRSDGTRLTYSTFLGVPQAGHPLWQFA